MADLPHYDTIAPAEMDYPEHERTYDTFLVATKWGTIVVIALLLAMMVGFFMSGGFTGGIFTFVVALVAAWFIAR